MPRPKRDPDLTALREKCKQLMRNLNHSNTNTKALFEQEQQIVVAALEAIYGKEAPKWIEDKLKTKEEWK